MCGDNAGAERAVRDICGADVKRGERGVGGRETVAYSCGSLRSKLRAAVTEVRRQKTLTAAWFREAGFLAAWCEARVPQFAL